MKLQFFHVKDLCRLMETILEKQPPEHVMNVGNWESVTIRDWVLLCYQAAGKEAAFVNVTADVEQRNYFSFYDYEYRLNVQKQTDILKETIPLDTGLREAFDWYAAHREEVKRKNYLQYIDDHFV